MKILVLHNSSSLVARDTCRNVPKFETTCEWALMFILLGIVVVHSRLIPFTEGVISKKAELRVHVSLACGRVSRVSVYYSPVYGRQTCTGGQNLGICEVLMNNIAHHISYAWKWEAALLQILRRGNGRLFGHYLWQVRDTGHFRVVHVCRQVLVCCHRYQVLLIVGCDSKWMCCFVISQPFVVRASEKPARGSICCKW